MYDSIRAKLGTFANYFTLPFGCIFSETSLHRCVVMGKVTNCFDQSPFNLKQLELYSMCHFSL